MPESIPFEIYDPEYIDEALCDLPEVKYMTEGQQFVLKASMINRAKAVHLFDSVQGFEQIIQEFPDVRQVL